MTFQDLLQGVLSGRYAVPQGALGSPQRPQIADMEAVRDLSRQRIAMTGQQPPIMSSGPMSGVLQPAPPPGSGPPLGPGLPPQGPPQGALAPSAGPGRDPGMAGALAPPGGPGIPQSAQVGAPPSMGYGRAPDSIGSGRPPMGPGWNPQLDPNQPQASPQPGNGVLALNNATAMAQANPMGPNQPPAPPGPTDQGPTPMALQSTDESTPVPQAKPSGALSSPTPDTAKSGDPVTRAKGILAAAASGDPGAFQAALTNPSAAAQVGSQTPDSAWNERSSYDGQAVSPTTPDGKPKPLSDQHAEDKQKTFGQRFMGALADPDTQDLLQSIGIGLLSNPNAMKGMAEGMQLYQGLHLRREQRNLEQKQIDVANKRADTAEKQGQQQIDQSQQRIGLEKGDQEIRRTAEENIARYRAQQLQQSASELGETRRYHDIEAGGQAATRGIERDRLRLEMGQPVSTQILPTPDGQGSKVVRTYRDNRIEVSDLPGVSAGVSLAALQGKQDVAAEGGMAAKANNALHELDDVNRTDQILAANPNGVGPSAASGTYRWVAQTLGLPGNDPVTELQNLKANQQLDLAVAKLKGQGQVSDKERALIGQAAQNVQTMSPELLKQLNVVRRKQALNDMGVYDAYLEQNPTRANGALAFDYKSRRKQMTDQGGPRSGADTSGSTPGGAVQTTPEEDALITKHLK